MHSKILLLAIFCLTAGCATLPRLEEKAIASPDPSHPPVKVPGLDKALDEAARTGGAVHLFLVHGMSNHPFGPVSDFKELGISDYFWMLEKLRDKNWRDARVQRKWFIQKIRKAQFDPLVPRLADKLKLKGCGEEPVLEWYEDEKGLLGYKLREEFMSECPATRTTRRLVVHRCAWAPVSIAEKIPLQWNDNYPQRGTFIVNKMVKDGMVSWGLADAAQYVGKSQDRIRLAVAKGIESMAREANLTTAGGRLRSRDRFAFGAASLGSIITLDTLAELAGNAGKHCWLGDGPASCVSLEQEAVQAMFSGELPLYLFANQIPLLHPAKAARSAKAKSSANLQEQIRTIAPESADNRFLIVAFNDPADFLGYRVPNLDGGKGVGIDVVNIMTRNQSSGIWWLGSSPLDAHTGFPKTRAVMNFIADGGEVTKVVDTGSYKTNLESPEPPKIKVAGQADAMQGAP